MRGYSRNSRPFSEICYNSYGRQMITTSTIAINQFNVVEELNKALTVHWKNREEIDYLERYYKGDQPIKYRVKPVRPEINNKTVENRAFEVVEFKAAENFGEPAKYVLKDVSADTQVQKSLELNDLNDYNELENKADVDVNMARDRSICGTSYKFHYNRTDYTVDESPFGICREEPKDTFVVYSTYIGNQALFSVQIKKDAKNKNFYFVYTKKQTFEIRNGKITEQGENGIGYIPVVEYPNNFYRLSDIEITIDLFDSINKMQSDRMNGVEQFVQSFLKFLNCEIDETEFNEMRANGCFMIKTTNPNVKADVTIMESQLDQTQTQVAKDDIYDSSLEILGMPDRQSNSGGDTGSAVTLRNGYYSAEKRAELSEHIYKKSENESIKIVLAMLRIKELTTLTLKNVDIKISRSKMENMLVKAQVFTMLTSAGVSPKVVTKVCNLFSDPEEVYLQSKPYLDAKYSPEVILGEENVSKTVETNVLS